MNFIREYFYGTDEPRIAYQYTRFDNVMINPYEKSYCAVIQCYRGPYKYIRVKPTMYMAVKSQHCISRGGTLNVSSIPECEQVAIEDIQVRMYNGRDINIEVEHETDGWIKITPVNERNMYSDELTFTVEQCDDLVVLQKDIVFEIEIII